MNGGLRYLRLLRNNRFSGRGALTQDFHAEGHRGVGHGVDTFHRFLGHPQIGAHGFERLLRDPSLDAQFCRATGDVRQRAHIGRDNAVLLRRNHLPDLFPRLDRGAGHQVDVTDLHRVGKRNHLSRGRDGARTAEKDKGRAEIDDKESEHTKHDRCIGNAHQASRRATAAFNGIGNVWIEAVDRDFHQACSSLRSPKRARRTRGGTKSSCRDVAKMISEE